MPRCRPRVWAAQRESKIMLFVLHWVINLCSIIAPTRSRNGGCGHSSCRPHHRLNTPFSISWERHSSCVPFRFWVHLVGRLWWRAFSISYLWCLQELLANTPTPWNTRRREAVFLSFFGFKDQEYLFYGHVLGFIA